MTHSLAGRLWRGAAAAYLVIIEPVWAALVADAALPRLIAFGAPAVALLVVRIAVVATGMAAGRAIWRGDAAAAVLGCCWAASSLAVTTLTWLTPYFPSNRTPSERRLVLTAAIVCYLGWYVVFSRQARAEARR